LTFLVLSLLAIVAAQTPPVSVQHLAAPEKALRVEVVVPASLDEVWTAFTTQAGLQSWLAQLLTQLRERFVSGPINWSKFK
jgi:uncharacterized protein YndB with AHSA1/START domain